MFDGAMADAKVYLNGAEIAAHEDGYTPFAARLTGKLGAGDNLITVVIDGSENPLIPPFGGRIDYLTYAGIYREAWIKVTAPVSIGNVKIETPDALAASKSVTVRVDLDNPQGLAVSGSVTVRLEDKAGKVLGTAKAAAAGSSVALTLSGLDGLALWELEDPGALYAGGRTRHAAWARRDGDRGSGSARPSSPPRVSCSTARRSSCAASTGTSPSPMSAMPWASAAQERDAEILKHELKLNMVRTSHYPQSTYFLDRCDELGLLVFEEIPGWQHIGGDELEGRSRCDNVRRMIERDWNHPSIIIWGVRINESRDDHDFYAETNRAGASSSIRRARPAACATSPTANCSKTSTR